MMLDATAGNRMMWPNKTPPLTVFMDKNIHAKIPPDVFGTWENPPFREETFETVLFETQNLPIITGQTSDVKNLYQEYITAQGRFSRLPRDFVSNGVMMRFHFNAFYPYSLKSGKRYFIRRLTRITRMET